MAPSFPRVTNTKALFQLAQASPLAGKTVNSNVGSVPLNVWTHVVFYYDGLEQGIYINGVKQNETLEWSGGIRDAGIDHLRAGNEVPVGTRAFDGTMDEIRFSNSSAFSIAWAKAEYNSGKDNLVSWGDEETK